MKKFELRVKIAPAFLGVGIFAALLAICFFVFQVPEFYPQVLAIIASAFLGAGVTAWITNTLLDNKQRSEETKEKNIKIYGEKLRIYQDFLKCLYDVIKDGEVTDEEAIRLQFQTSYITMHTKSEHIKVIAQQVKSIVSDLKEDNNARLMQCLFAIVEEFKKELYSSELTEEDRRNIEEAVESFGSIMDAVEVKQEEIDNNDSDNENNANLAQNLNEFVEALHNRIENRLGQWIFKAGDCSNGINVDLRMKGHEDDARVIISYEDGNREQYFQVHLEHDDSHEAYKHMKWKFGGRQNKWSWWKYFDTNWRVLANTQEVKNHKWDEVLEYIEKKLTELLTYVEVFVKVRQEVYYQASNIKADKVWMYYNNVVAFDYPERIFFDVELHNEGYTIRIGHRDDDVSQLLLRLKKIGFDVMEQELDSDKRYKAYKNISVGEILNRIKEIDSKL